MNRWGYGMMLVLLFVAAASILAGGAWTWVLPIFVFGAVPLVELFWTGDGAPPLVAGTAVDDPLLRLWPVLCVPGQLGLLGIFLWRVPALAGAELGAAVLTMGVACGTYGINVAHELGHRPQRSQRVLSRVLLTTSLYVHFHVEHNRGHHARVATDADPASAPAKMSVYAFWLRSITGGVRSALALEARRLRRRQGLRRWLEDEVVVGLSVQAVLLGLVALVSPMSAAAWVGAALIGVLLLETVNYVEHYGLRRQEVAPGRWETVAHWHSWTADHPLGRVLLLELTRHADHHAHAERPYAALRHHDDAPRLPTGYPGMILLALVPPLFWRLMDRQLDQERRRLALAS